MEKEYFWIKSIILNSNVYRHTLCHTVCHFVEHSVKIGGVQNLNKRHGIRFDKKTIKQFACFSMQTRLSPSHMWRLAELSRAARLDIAAKEAEQLQVLMMLSIRLAYKQLVRL